MSSESWARALDAIEERLRRQEAVVRGASQEPVTGGLPVADGPIPPELRDRAMALLQRTRELEAEGEVAMTKLRAQMQRRSSTTGASPYADRDTRAQNSQTL